MNRARRGSNTSLRQPLVYCWTAKLTRGPSTNVARLQDVN
jgi:hypothetical protein